MLRKRMRIGSLPRDEGLVEPLRLSPMMIHPGFSHEWESCHTNSPSYEQGNERLELPSEELKDLAPVILSVLFPTDGYR